MNNCVAGSVLVALAVPKEEAEENNNWKIDKETEIIS